MSKYHPQRQIHLHILQALHHPSSQPTIHCFHLFLSRKVGHWCYAHYIISWRLDCFLWTPNHSDNLVLACFSFCYKPTRIHTQLVNWWTWKAKNYNLKQDFFPFSNLHVQRYLDCIQSEICYKAESFYSKSLQIWSRASICTPSVKY